MFSQNPWSRSPNSSFRFFKPDSARSEGTLVAGLSPAGVGEINLEGVLASRLRENLAVLVNCEH